MSIFHEGLFSSVNSIPLPSGSYEPYKAGPDFYPISWGKLRADPGAHSRIREGKLVGMFTPNKIWEYTIYKRFDPTSFVRPSSPVGYTWIRQSLLIAIFLVFPACASVTDQMSNNQPVSVSTPSEQSSISWPTVLEDAGPADLSWINAYSEPDLTRLVEDAQRNHYDIRALAPRMERAIALADGAALALQEALAAESENEESSSQEIPTHHRRQVTWEADVWRRLQDGNYASIELAAADTRAARASLNASIVSTYFLLLEANRQKTVLRGHLISSRELVNKIELKAASANADAKPQSSRFWDPSTGEERLNRIDEARRKASQSLEILIHGFPPVLLSTKQSLPILPPNLSPGLSSKSLEQRPDLLAAALNFVEVHAQLDQSYAPSLPMFDLFEEFGAPSKQLIEYADSMETDWRDENRFLILQDPVRYIETTGDPGIEWMQSIAQYETVALNAFREVRALSASTQHFAERRAVLEVAEAQSKSALEATLNGNETGEQHFRRILNELQNLYRFRTTLLTVRRQQLNHHATMMLSLG